MVRVAPDVTAQSPAQDAPLPTASPTVHRSPDAAALASGREPRADASGRQAAAPAASAPAASPPAPPSLYVVLPEHAAAPDTAWRRYTGRRALPDPLAGQIDLDGQAAAGALTGPYLAYGELLPEHQPGTGARYYANNWSARKRNASARRRKAHQSRRELWRMSTLERVRKCGRVSRRLTIEVVVTPDGEASTRGLTTCGSVWACPVCSDKINAARADELATAIQRHHDAGGTVALATFTMRHKRGQGLRELWDGVSSAWSAARQGRAQRRALDALGCVGWARRVEVTHGANGWHVHVHALLFLGAEAEADVDNLGAVWSAWRNKLIRLGFDAPLRDRGGFDVRMVAIGNAGEVAGYVAGVGKHTARGAAFELASATGKKAARGNRTPFDILADYSAIYRCDSRRGKDAALALDRALWAEWERVSEGRRALTWSGAIRELLRLGDEVEDDDLADELDAESEHAPVATWTAREWSEVCWHDVPGLLDAIERAPHEERYVTALRWSRRHGLPPPRRPVPSDG